MQSVLTSHLVFDLRQVSSTNMTSNSQHNRGANLPGFSSINFAQSILEEFGAPLGLFGNEDFHEDSQQQQHMQNFESGIDIMNIGQEGEIQRMTSDRECNLA